ncbi:hypothetical protein [Acetobacter estunensis]|uniref:hypothetical protein n=1 Tax=Acetobacter estunensis TaxID=104097 RepID=UPI001C2CFC07|nr:hypothetical protein [Acetobacter estunensis]MBV1838460.1 hypothetical protein [Acetobacter estunensis]
MKANNTEKLIKEIDSMINHRSELLSKSNEFRREYLKYIDCQNDDEYELFISNKEKSIELDEEIRTISKSITLKFKKLEKYKNDISYLERKIEEIRLMYLDTCVDESRFSSSELISFMNDDYDLDSNTIVRDAYRDAEKREDELNNKYGKLRKLYYNNEYTKVIRELKRIEKEEK